MRYDTAVAPCTPDSGETFTSSVGHRQYRCMRTDSSPLYVTFAAFTFLASCGGSSVGGGATGLGGGAAGNGESGRGGAAGMIGAGGAPAGTGGNAGTGGTFPGAGGSSA